MERANTQQPATGGATRMVAKTDDGTVTVKLTQGEKRMAEKFFGGDYAKYAKSKRRHAEGGVIG